MFAAIRICAQGAWDLVSAIRGAASCIALNRRTRVAKSAVESAAGGKPGERWLFRQWC